MFKKVSGEILSFRAAGSSRTFCEVRTGFLKALLSQPFVSGWDWRNPGME